MKRRVLGKPPFDALQLTERLEGELDGVNVTVDRLTALGPGCEDAVVVLLDPSEFASLDEWHPAVVVGPSGLVRPQGTEAYIRVADPRHALALLTRIFDSRPLPAEGIHPAASVAADARLGRDVRIAAGAVVGSGSRIGGGTVIGAGAVVGDGAVVGRNCRFHANAAALDGVRLGDRVILQAGAVIGSDGFGYAPTAGGAVKLHHLGSVVIDDDVEIGANTTIDRGTLGDTEVGARTKIDNLCQIAHNVRIGADCLIAGHCGIAGSSSLGDRVVLAGGAGIGDHLEIGDGAVVGPGAGVLKSIPAGETWMGYPAQPRRKFSRQSYLVSRLERIWRFVKQSENRNGDSRAPREGNEG